MIYFLDFEATQYTNEIISIGCINENGLKFSSFVKPTHKITKFITALTGITNEMIEIAPSIEEAIRHFHMVYNFKPNDVFYCYGSGDKDFIKGTMRYTTDAFTLDILSRLHDQIHDYSEDVKQFFGLTFNIPMKTVATFIQDQDVIQVHDALADAIILLGIYDNLQRLDKPAICPFPPRDPSLSSTRIRPKSNKKMKYRAKKVGGEHSQNFCSIEAVLKFLKIKNPEEKTIARVTNRINTAIQNNTIYADCYWIKL